MSIVHIYKKILFYSFALLTFFTPLIFVANTNELFELPKMFFVYFMGSTIITLFILKTLLTSTKLTPPHPLVLAFLAGYIISTVFSTHLYTSIWGYYTRFNGGLISILILIGLYTIAINEFKSNQIKRFIAISTINVIPISIYGISQHYEFIGNIWGANPAERVFSTFGQPNWLAAYLTMIIPLILLFSLKSQQRSKIFWSTLYILAFTTLWFTYSISGLLGLIGGVVSLTVINKDLLTKQNKKFLSLLVFLSFLIAISNPGIFKNRIQDTLIDVRQFISLEKIAHAAEEIHSISDPGYIRKHLWKGSLNLIFSNPKILIMGTGPETFPYSFQKFRLPELNYSSEWNFVFNKPHNYYLELLSNLGVITIIPYSIILISSIRKKDGFLTPGLIALYITNIFGWPTVSTALLFWFFIAGIRLKENKK